MFAGLPDLALLAGLAGRAAPRFRGPALAVLRWSTAAPAEAEPP